MLDLEKFRSGLSDLGFRPSDGPGANTLSFMYEGGSYYLDVDPEDSFYVRLGFPAFITLKPHEHAQALQAANKVTESMKVVKTYLIGDKVYCSVEQFTPDEDQFLWFLRRNLIALQGGAKAFIAEAARVS
jgi:hypothetical protein